ncbi:acyl carrier protein [Desulfovibrio sp. 86]|uniref:ACP-SH:acetate ligase n=1 Tax=uncultured Desulfovibrio sp. TaxID=167968 RepID=A0A212KZT5_9BACT|nr:acyl carrier protein [Desulfovibrio sp. 86]SCM70798.1 ACP-SH:acetate ligase [uncultured Desulfovibrio sp.]VZH32512.1 ACP-SH:acetate ligase [Desulfovibrio sp. 86]
MCQKQLENLAAVVEKFGSAPTIADMPRRTLADKGINGPTAAHVIEEVHSPYNLAYLTFTTGSSAFQNIVGVTFEELPDRKRATQKALEMANISRGAHALVTYAPLVNVYSAQALHEYGMTWSFLLRSSRDALIVALCRDKPKVLIGESGFLKVALEDVANLGLAEAMPRDCIVLCSGTPLDLDIIPLAQKYGWQIHDLYGCQEFGWIALDGRPLRDDISLVPSPLGDDYKELVLGGLPLADSFIIGAGGHECNSSGQILTYRRKRTHPEYEVLITATTFSDPTIIEKAARSILRIKSRVVKVHPHIKCNAEATEMQLVTNMALTERDAKPAATITGPQKTRLFDSLVEAQIAFQKAGKTDPTWVKKS